MLSTFRKRFLRAIALWTLLAALVDGYLLRVEYREQLEYWQDRLTRVASINERLLESWLGERRGDSREIASFDSIRKLVTVGGGAAGPQAPGDLQVEIDAFVKATTAAGVYVLDDGGRILARSTKSPPLIEEVSDACKASKTTQVMTIVSGEPGPYPQLAVLAPVSSTPGAGTDSVAKGCVAVLTLPEDIGAIISTEAGSTETGESLLVTYRGNKPVFISSLRLHDLTAPFPEVPRQGPAIAVLNSQGEVFGEFRDYRGVRVLASARYIPAVGWAMVTKIDRREALTVFYQSVFRAIAITLASLLLVAALVAFLGRQQRIEELQTTLVNREREKEQLRTHGEILEKMKAQVEISEERMRFVFEAAMIGFFDWDVIHETQVWSETCRVLLGLPVDAAANFEVLMRSIHPEDRDYMMEEINKARTEKKGFSTEYRSVWPDGSLHWHLAKGRAFFNDAGETVRVAGVVVDIDQLKRAEARLHLQAVALEAAANAIVITDAKGRIMRTNPAFSELTGYSAEEAAGKNLRILKSGKQDKEFYRKMWTTILSGRVWQGEIINRRKDGSLYTEEAVITPVRTDKKITNFIAIKQDITARKRNEEERRRTEEKYRAIYEDAVIGIFQTTPGGRVISVNPALAKICGYDNPEELIAGITDISNEWYVDPQRRADLQQELERDGFVRSFEYQAKRKDGTKAWLLQSIRVVRDESGKPAYYEGTIQDITERKILEDQLRQAQKMEAVGRLAGGIAHDFNNALSVINGYSELLQQELAADAGLSKQAGEIHSAGRRAASLTRQLLAFSRKQTIQLTVLDLNSVLTDIEKMLRRLIGEDISLEIALGKGLKNVKVDRGQMEQIFMNLAINARDAMPKGGKLLIETGNAQLDEMYLRQHPDAKTGPYAMLSVSDTGCGMDKETQAHIFEPFFTTKDVGKGTGLGLSTVYGIVKQSGGHVSVYSEVDKGTTFRLYLPACDAAQATSGVETRADVPAGKETILMVEDDPALRELTKNCLLSKGYTVVAAENGQTAIEASQKHAGVIHMLLTDVIMPKMSGPELAQTLTRARPEMKVLFMSGYTDDLIAHHGMLDSGTMLIEKPFDINSLLTKVRQALEGGGSKARGMGAGK
ncbi:MAG TPA: PAS domain S-box protein [Terriglobales bacterium]